MSEVNEEDKQKFLDFLDFLDIVNLDTEKMDLIVEFMGKYFKVIKHDQFISEMLIDNQLELGGVEMYFSGEKLRKCLISSLTFYFNNEDNEDKVYMEIEYVSFDFNYSDSISFCIDQEQAHIYIKKFGFTGATLYDSDNEESEEYEPESKYGFDFDEMYKKIGG